MTNVEDKVSRHFKHHDPFYRLGVGMIILNKDNKVLIGKRIDMAHTDLASAWQMPQGGIDVGENPGHAVLREMSEEIGTNDVYLLAQTKEWLHYDFPKELAATLWGGRFVGQSQLWYLFRFTGKDSDINIQTRHPEFCAWRWEDPKELPNLIVPFKKDLYQKLLIEFSEYLTPDSED